MANILVTGMTASQASPKNAERTQSYASELVEALRSGLHTVTWTDPKVEWTLTDLDDYDHVIVGVAPITSTAANRSYGALNVIEKLFYDERLSLFLDAPIPAQVTASLRSVARNPKSLVKPFYHKRPGFGLVQEPRHRASIYKAVDLLLEHTWPKTLYPALPWAPEEPKWLDNMPDGLSRIHGLNLDAYLIGDNATGPAESVDRWVADDLKSKWAKKTIATLSKPVELFRPSRFTTDAEVANTMHRSWGTLIGPCKDGLTWWSPRYAQSLTHAAPVATEWRDSVVLDKSWGVLPAAIEDMTAAERYALVREQLDSYSTNVPGTTEAQHDLHEILGIKEVEV